MEKKARFSWGALMIIGLVYTILGTVFAVLGIVLAVIFRQTEEAVIGLTFGGIGMLFLVLGIVFLALEIRKKRRADKLLEAGRYVWGEVVDCVPNFSVRINGRHPYMAMVQYVDAAGTRHLFRSHASMKLRNAALCGRNVKVYVEDDSFRHYYVDLEEETSNVIVH